MVAGCGRDIKLLNTTSSLIAQHRQLLLSSEAIFFHYVFKESSKEENAEKLQHQLPYRCFNKSIATGQSATDNMAKLRESPVAGLRKLKFVHSIILKTSLKDSLKASFIINNIKAIERHYFSFSWSYNSQTKLRKLMSEHE